MLTMIDKAFSNVEDDRLKDFSNVEKDDKVFSNVKNQKKRLSGLKNVNQDEMFSTEGWAGQ